MTDILDGRLSVISSIAICLGVAVGNAWLPISDNAGFNLLAIFILLSLGLYKKPLILGAFFVVGITVASLSNEGPGRLLVEYAAPVKKIILQKIEINIPDDSKGLVRAMFLGDKSYSQKEKILKSSGLGHLMAVSGFHVGIISGVSQVIVKNVTTRFWKTGLIRLYLPVAAGAISAVFMACIAGLRASVIRAASVVAAAALATILGRRVSTCSKVAAGVIFCTAISPGNTGGAGMYLSLAGYLGITELSRYFRTLLKSRGTTEGQINPESHNYLFQKSSIVVESIIISVSAQIATLPLILRYFNEYPLCGLTANLLVLPAISVLMPAGVAAIILPEFTGSFIGNVFAQAMSILINFTQELQSIFPAMIIFKPSISAVASYYSALFFLVKNRGRTALILMIAAFTLCLPLKTYRQGITAVDVGNGDCTLLVNEEIPLLIDTPGGKAESALKAMSRYNLNMIEMAFITHAHSDHQDGIVELILGGHIRTLVIPDIKGFEDIIGQTLAKGISVKKVSRGDEICSGNFKVEVLWPPKDFFSDDLNDTSLVMRITCNDKSILLTGDECRYWSKWACQADVLKLPHHGAYFDGFNDMLETVRPQEIYVSVGKNNIYGHPDKRSSSCVNNGDAEFFRTDYSGDIQMTFD